MKRPCPVCRNENLGTAQFCGRCGAPLVQPTATGPPLAKRPAAQRGRRFCMRQKFWAWGDDYLIKDALGHDAYFVDGQAFSFGNKLSFQDMQGRELAFISQKLLSWGPTYEIWAGDQLVAVIKKKLFTFFRHEFLVDVPGPDDPIAEGDFLAHEYTFSRQGRQVARVSKQWFTFLDTYGIDIAPGEGEILILASAVVIDLVCHQ